MSQSTVEADAALAEQADDSILSVVATVGLRLFEVRLTTTAIRERRGREFRQSFQQAVAATSADFKNRAAQLREEYLGD